MNRKQSDFLMMIIMSMTLLCILLFSVIKINSVVHGQGVIVTKDNTQIVSLSKGGTIDHIYVSAGDFVKKGQVLAQASNLDVEKEYQRDRVQYDYLKKYISELNSVLESNAIIDIDVQNMTNHNVASNILLTKSQVNTKRVKIRGLNSDIEGLNINKISKHSELSLINEEINILSPLVKKGISSYTNMLSKKQSAVRLKSELIELDNQISTKKDEISLITSEIDDAIYELRNFLSKELNDSTKELAMVSSSATVTSRQIQETKVRSPIDGIIYQINKNASTEGGVIQAADALFEIKPISMLMQAEVKIQPKDRDQIYIEGPVNVNISSFMMVGMRPYKGMIEHISPDSYEETINGSLVRYYKVVVKFQISKSDLEKIKPGMTVDANVITGKHSIMRYLISPLIKGSNQIFSEPVTTNNNRTESSAQGVNND